MNINSLFLNEHMQDHYLGIMNGEMSFGKYESVASAMVEGLKYPGPDVALMGSDKNENNWYNGRKVFIQKDSLFFPDENFGIYGSNDYIFPDANNDISQFQAPLEALLAGIDVDAKKSVMDIEREDSFLYGISTHDIPNGNVFFLRLTRYKDEPYIEQFKKYFNTPHSPLALCFEGGKWGRKSQSYIHHSGINFWISYLACSLQENKKEDFSRLLEVNKDITVIKSELGVALSNPLYMEALCHKIEEIVEPHFQRTFIST